MIAGIFHEGSGLGDQLFRYITVRTLAEEKGFDWTMVSPENFKGSSFLSPEFNFDKWGEFNKQWKEKVVRNEQGDDIRSYDPEINFVEGNTVIDGSFEDSKYWAHNLSAIDKWLEVEPLDVPENLCVIGFRGGEYYADKDLGLPKAYFDKAIEKMRQINAKMEFQVHTDDPTLAREFFPDIEIVENTPISHSKHSNMGYNWRSARFAKYAIIPNSAFFILPRLLSHHQGPPNYYLTIAPRYWARYNTRVWARPACYYKPFTYIHAEDTD